MTEKKEQYEQEQTKVQAQPESMQTDFNDKVVIVIEFAGADSAKVNVIANKVTTEQMLLAAKMLDEVAKRSLHSIWNQQEQEARQRAMQQIAFEKKVQEQIQNEEKRKRR